MKMLYFASRNQKEIIRDPLSSVLGIVMPVFFIFLFSIIAKNAPIEVFKPVNIVPAMTIFGFSFLTLFLAILIARDKSSSFLSRLFISPLTSNDFIFGYMLPMLPISFLICLFCFISGIFIGVPVSMRIIFTFLTFIPYVLFASVTGVLLGTICNETKVLVAGNIFIQLSAILGGAWMDLNILGDTIKTIAGYLPFSHAIEASRAALSGRTENILYHLAIVSVYILVFFLLAVIFFNIKMKSDNK
ncbi:MAG: ABC transporter permease [Spirochaetales bacterium]|nr:ABC transporter permease [Spirochaetales bacterium]